MKMIGQDQVQRTQRVKVGMIGLAAVLLLIGLASAIFSTMYRDREVAAIGSARPDVVATIVSGNASTSDAQAKEPLAELGVAPSAALSENAASPVATRRPAKR